MVSYAYDRDSNRTTLTYPGPASVTYAYSNGGRLSVLTDWASRTTAYTYSAAGLVTTVSLPNGMVTTHTYDRAQRPTALTNARSGITVTSHQYTLDNEGNRTALSEFVSGLTAPLATDSFGLSYDGLHRLKAVTTTNPESFTLDAASNLSARSGPAASYTIDGANRPTSDGTNAFLWSAANRLVARGPDTFSYDPLDRLVSSTVAGTARTYAYNGDGLLQSRSELLSTVTYLWDTASSPARLLQRGSDRIVHGLAPLYAVSALGATTTFAPDALGSVRAEVSDAGLVSASFRYRSYGQLAQFFGAAAPTSLGYAGELGDPSGLLYLRARWYDPATGRFLTSDPVMGDPSSPATLNAYGYAGANPVMNTDPSGECVKCHQYWTSTVSPWISRNSQGFVNAVQRWLPFAPPVSRAVAASELGIGSQVKHFAGTFSLKGNTATLRIDMIERLDGSRINPFAVIARALDLARDARAAVLRIEGTLANERLMDVLKRRYDLITDGATEFIQINVR